MGELLQRLSASIGERYRVERVLGTGGMATVYLAKDLRYDRDVAIKVLREDLGATLGGERFLAEIKTTAKLQHPHILPLLDSGEADGMLFYVMPYVDGETLRERLKRETQLPIDDALHIALEIADALSYAHGQGIIHRDIKPENVLLQGGHALVTDFGIALAVQQSVGQRLTQSGLSLGTPQYMAPEQATADRTIDQRADIYALGAVTYEMLTGEPPFTGATAQALLARKSLQAAPSIRIVRPQVPAGVDRAVQKGLAMVPADRFATVQEFAAALSTESIAPAGILRGTTRKTKVLVASALAVAAITIGALLIPALFARPRMQRLAVLPFENLMNDPAQDYFVQGMHEALISELTRARIVVIARTSVMHYLNVEKSARQIADELRVDGLIEGSVFRSGDSVEIRVRLVDGHTEQYLWSESYSGAMKELVPLQRRMTRAIAGEMRFALSPGAEAHLASTATLSPDAYDAYLKGRFYSYRLNARDFKTALSYFQLALDKQPAYAAAYTGIAFAWAAQGYLGMVAPHEAFPKASEAIVKALSLDDSLAEAHDVRARVGFYYGLDWKGAEQEFRRAIALNPNYPDAHSYYGLMLTWIGRPEDARFELGRALELDPLNPLFQFHLALHYLVSARRDDQAISNFRKAVQAIPDFPWSHHYLWLALHERKRYVEAAAEARIYFGAQGLRQAADAFEDVHDEAGYRSGLTLAAARLAADSTLAEDRAAWIAELYSVAGQTEKAVGWLERAFRNGDPYLVTLGQGLGWNGLRTDPHFDNLLGRMRFPHIPAGR